MPNKMNCKRVLAFALALLVLMTMLPTAVFAQELPFNVATSTDIAPIPTEMNLRETIAAEGFAYAQPIKPAKVYDTPDLSADSHLYTLTDTTAVLLATEHTGSSVKVWYCVGAEVAMRGYVDANDLSDACLSADQVASLTKDVDCRQFATDAGNMTLYFAAGEFNLNLVEETTVDNPPAEEPETTPENEMSGEDDSVTPAVNSETASENTPLPTGTIGVQLPVLAGDCLQVTTDTRVFSEMDETATENYFGDLYLGVFVRNAIVRVEQIQQDKADRCWCLVTFLYGDDFANGRMKWTATDTAWILADEAAKTDQTELTVTDYAYPLGTPVMQPMSLSATAMNGFSLKKANGSVGSFSVGDTAYGSSGRDSEYKQIATVEGQGKVYATPHYLEGYTVYCLEHTLPGPGENISGGGQQPTGPYTIVDWDGYMSTAGYSGAIYGENTMHAIAWVLGHTYPFMVLDRSDSNNDTWSRVAGQFAIREVVKQMEGAQYVRDYWDMDNFYAASNNAPGVYLEYARWLTENAIAHARRTGEIAVSNKSASYANGCYNGTATFTTDADFMRISKSIGTLMGHTGGEDDSYYYLNSGDTVTVCSANPSFAYSVESMMDDEAGFYVGIPSVAIQKVLIPIESTPYPANEVTVDFSVAFGTAVITKRDADTGAALAGAAFELLTATGEVIGTATTDTDGTAAFENLQPGTYTIRETSAPTGYTLSVPNTQSLTVAAGQTAYATFANEKISGKIAVYKVDADSREPLAGAVFTITDASGHVVEVLTTNADGNAESGWLTYGSYTITETAAPEHYVNSGFSQTINAFEDGKTYLFEVQNEPTKGYLRVTKTNSLDQTPIAGVTFDIFQNGQVVDSIVTDETGVALSEPLPKGIYTVSERDTPTGYVQEIVNLKVEVRSDETTDLLVTNKPIQGKIRIEKSDSQTGDTIAGATFTITRISGLPSHSGNGEVVAVVTTDTNGVAETPMLTYGVYRVEETTVPEHYVDSGFSVDIAIHEEDMGTYLVDCENEPTKGWIQLVKVDALDRTPIAGVGFDIYSGGKLISSMTTDENGVALSEPLPKGKYMVCEQENPIGYTDDLVVLDAVVKSDETTYLSCTNQPIQGRIQIMKRDQLTGEALAGAEFTVLRLSGLPSHNSSDNGETVAVITTDAGGMAITPLLTWGTYRIVETKVPEHYVDNAFSIEVTVGENQKVYTIDVENEPSKGWIRLTKTDSLNGNPIEGVQFDIYHADVYGEGLAGTMVTDENGIAMSEPLRKGQYIVREHGETAGYVFEEMELAATVKPDEITDLTAVNQPVQVQLKLYKRDTDEYSGRVDDTPNTRGDGVLTGAAFQVLAAEDITDRQGNLLFAKEDVVVPSLKTAGAEASVLTDSLWPGVYKIVEVTPPEGYQPAMDAIIIDATGAAEQSAEALVAYEGVITNEILYGAQAIVKVLGSNNSTADPTRVESPEAGAEFKVYLKSAGSYENARGFERDYLITDENGYAMTKPLPYGVYVLEQTAGKDCYEIKGPIEFNIDGSESLVNPPLLTLSDRPILYRLKLIKTDANTGKVIALSGTSFKIKDSKGQYLTQTVYYPHEMKIDTFTTDETGSVTLPETVNWGHYFIEEIAAPEGYLLRKDELAVFIGKDGDQPGQTYEVEINIPNEAVMGSIELVKTGLILTGFENVTEQGYEVTRPIYEEGYLAGSTFEIRAAERIMGKDGTVWYQQDELVETITTSGTGSGMSKELPLGRYYLIETAAPEGYMLEDIPYEVELAYQDSHTPVVTVQVASCNQYLPASVSLVKHKEVTETVTSENGTVHQVITTAPGEGFTFGPYNAKDIHSTNATLLADTLLAVGVTDEQGLLHISGCFPHGQYYLKELAAPDGWKLSPQTFPVNILPDTAAEDAEVIEIVYPEVVYNELIYTPVTLTKTDMTGVEPLPGALIEVQDTEGNLLYRDYTNESGEIADIPLVPGTYTFHETLAPDGYELNTAEMTFAVDEWGNITGDTVIRDDFTRVTLVKQDMSGHPLAGVTFALRSNETTVATAKSDADGIITFEKIPWGEYTIQEIQPLPGYMPNDTVVHLTMDGSFVNSTEPLAVVENQSIEVILHKIDKDGKPLSGAIFGLFDSDGFLCMTALSDSTGTAKFTYVPYGSYTIRELEAPDGYLLNQTVISVTIDEAYRNSVEPLATVVNQAARLAFKKVNTSGKPLPGVAFSLIDAETGMAIETAESDDNGEFVFTRFTYGKWIVRETETPEGYNPMPDMELTVDENWVEPEPFTLINIPNHYEFIKTDNRGNPLSGVKFALEDGAGNILRELVSGEDGIVHVTGLTPGVYIIREIETLGGYTLSEETIQVIIDERYVVPDEPFRFVNYPIIQTGAGLEMTALMWFGVALVCIGCAAVTVCILLDRHRPRK